MATALQRSRLRADIADTNTVFSDPEVDDLFTRAEAQYPGNENAAHYRACQLAVTQLMSDSAKRASYSANASSESLSDVFKHLRTLRDLFKEEVSEAVAQSGSGVMFGSLNRFPSRDREYPDA